ncbi:MAG: hypothetical protein TR69_WS6001000176 [candidate division WS6 bacterium OLB20]|uniref:Uncharacterized protein n=1 Tax=candidate division WS6 bacterium OLB20 TaxID=1617426 RepID=A0A136M078_9BACT|nr:MAG: hypothetical protein TR69_WS6001000176 [candidate division WS6 bacterium OLB20]
MVIKASTTRRNRISRAIRQAMPSRDFFSGVDYDQKRAVYAIVAGISALFVMIAISITGAVAFNASLQRQIAELRSGSAQEQPDFSACGENGTIVSTSEGEICITESGSVAEPTPTPTLPPPTPVTQNAAAPVQPEPVRTGNTNYGGTDFIGGSDN